MVEQAVVRGQAGRGREMEVVGMTAAPWVALKEAAKTEAAVL